MPDPVHADLRPYPGERPAEAVPQVIAAVGDAAFSSRSQLAISLSRALYDVLYILICGVPFSIGAWNPEGGPAT